MKKYLLTMLIATMFAFIGCTEAVTGDTVDNDNTKTEEEKETTASYTVEHYQQNIENDEFTLVNDDTEEKSGKIGEDTKAIAKTYEGFTAKTVTQEKIAADGSTVVKIEYTRNGVTLTFDTDGGSEITSKSGKYGAELTVEAPTKDGYTFNSWNPALPTSFPEEDTEYKAIWNELTPTENIEKIIEEIKALTEKGTHTIKITGKIAGYTISEIKEALEDLDEGIYVNLDLSETTGLTSIEKNESYYRNYNYTFNNCDKLAGISIPDSVTTIGYYAFYNCSNLESVTIPDSVTTIGSYAFEGCTSLANVTIPDSVTEIGFSAFEGCTSLANVTIPDSVTEIGYHAFNGCTGLTSVTIGNGVTEIGYFAFLGCTSLANVTIPDSVTAIGGYAFYGCTVLTSVTIPDSVTAIGGYAFYGCTVLTSVTIPDSVTSIGGYAFYGCTSLTNVTIGNGVTSIGGYAFKDCTVLTSVTIPDSVTSIGDYAFIDCTGLTSVTIPDSVTTIGNHAFNGCTNLTSVTIPDSVTSIGNYAFYWCNKLTSVTFADTTSTWYCTSISSYTGGTEIDVTDPTKNATYLESTYYYKYWYKKASSIE